MLRRFCSADVDSSRFLTSASPLSEESWMSSGVKLVVNWVRNFKIDFLMRLVILSFFDFALSSILFYDNGGRFCPISLILNLEGKKINYQELWRDKKFMLFGAEFLEYYWYLCKQIFTNISYFKLFIFRVREIREYRNKGTPFGRILNQKAFFFCEIETNQLFLPPSSLAIIECFSSYFFSSDVQLWSFRECTTSIIPSPRSSSKIYLKSNPL